MRAHSKSIQKIANTLSRAATVSGSEKIVRHHVPNDMGEPGLKTRSMWWKRSGSPRSETRNPRSSSKSTSATGYATFAAALKFAGAANSQTAATMKSPVAIPFIRASIAMVPPQDGTFVIGVFS